jgi:hypothetical protein
MLWVRISDIAEEMRRKKIESELQNSGWVSADMMGGNAGGVQPDMQFQPPPGSNNFGPGGSPQGGAMRQQGSVQPQTGPVMVDDWFSLEPVGRIHLTMSFGKQTTHILCPSALTVSKPNTLVTRRHLTLDWAGKALFVSERKRWSNSTVTNSCNSSSTTLCVVLSAASFSSMLLACSARTATTPATKSVIQRSSPSVSPSPTPKPIRTKPNSTTVSLIASRTFPIWAPTGVATAVTSSHLVGSKPRNVQVSCLCVSRWCR